MYQMALLATSANKRHCNQTTNQLSPYGIQHRCYKKTNLKPPPLSSPLLKQFLFCPFLLAQTFWLTSSLSDNNKTSTSGSVLQLRLHADSCLQYEDVLFLLMFELSLLLMPKAFPSSLHKC